MELPPVDLRLPSRDEVAAELEEWRRRGVLRLGQLRLPDLGRAAQAAGLATSSYAAAQPSILKELIRTAIAPIAGSASGRCATVLLGLDPNTFDVAPNLLREDAAEILGLSVERFRRDPQHRVLLIVADAVLEICAAYRARAAHLAMEQRHPADTRLAVHWLERFEAYFRIWTPTYALGADLTAYRETLIDPERPWDRGPGDDDSSENQYSQELQAAGHATFALYHYAAARAAEREFVIRFGGLWLLSSPAAEVEARDALALSTARLAMNERELHPFLESLQRSSIGRATHDEWQECLGRCNCKWAAGEHDPGVEYFPTSRYHQEIRPDCPVHRTVEACNRYCAVIEQEWLKVSDWYGAVEGPSSRDHS
jgi:hypothetical protein